MEPFPILQFDNKATKTLAVLVFLSFLGIGPAHAQEERSITFVQLTDAHLFDSGKSRKGSNDLSRSLEAADSRLAWDWAILEINRLVATGRTIDFVAYTGDFGLEKVCPEEADCPEMAAASRDVAQALDNLPVARIYLVRGNNDLLKENPDDVERFDIFARLLSARVRNGKEVINLTPGSASTAIFDQGGIKVVGLDSSSFKNEPTKDDKDQKGCAYQGAEADWKKIIAEHTPAQRAEMSRVNQLVQGNSPTLILTHIPDLDDPWRVNHCAATDRVASWNLAADVQSQWQKIISRSNVLAVFAGHFHTGDRFIYQQPYSWERTHRAHAVEAKTYVAPPLAAKFQVGVAPQARGFLLATVAPTKVERTEIHWFAYGVPVDVAQRGGVPTALGWKWSFAIALAAAAILGAVLLWALAKRNPKQAAERSLEYRTLETVGIVSTFVMLSLAIVWFARGQLGITESVTVVTLLIVPLVVYGIVSGRLAELTAPGGWGAKFRQEATDKVDLSLTPVEFQDLTVIPKEGLLELQARIGHIREGQAVVLSMILGGTIYYDQNAVVQALQLLSPLRRCKFVVLLDPEKRLVAYFPADIMLRYMQMLDSQQLIAAINDGSRARILGYLGVITETISRQTTNAQALEQMEKLGLDALVAVDGDSKVIGVAEQGRILSRMLVALAKDAKA